MRPIHSREEYLALRDSAEQKAKLAAIRSGNEALKRELVQFNYSCLPNADGTLKGSKRMSTTVAMDIDHVSPEQMQPLKECILAHKDELGLGMLEGSARGQGFHFVFTRRPELSQEANLEWAANLLSVEHDKGAKDITRVFYTTTEAELIYLDDKVFEIDEVTAPQFSRICNSAEPNMGICNPHGISNADIKSSRITNSTEHAEPATAESLAKFDLCAQQAGLDSQSMDIWGERNWHSNLMAVLSVGVGKLMSREQLFAVVGERLKNYSQTNDCKTLINYFYDNYSADKGFLNASLREINAKAQKHSQDQDDELEFDQTTPDPSYSGGELCAKKMPQKAQTPLMLDTYDVIADTLIDNALCFFRERIENAMSSRNYVGANGERTKRGRNDSIYERFDVQFSWAQAMQFSVAVKGAGITHNSVRQMLKNWRNQGLIVQTAEGKYRKVS